MISVVIPLYNKAHTIERTLSTVFSQTLQNFEVIIVNDGSTDNGVDVIRNFTSDTRLQVINQSNQGVSAARNKGVAFAKYDYIAFLDGDDEWMPEYLAKMKEAIEKFPDGVMYCCAGIVRNDDGTEFYRLASKYRDKIIEINFFENPHVFLHTSATIVLKSTFLKTDGFPLGMKRNEDYALFFTLALIGKVIYCAFPLSIYIGGIEGQATSIKNNETQQNVIERFNYTFLNWIKYGRKNLTFKVFLKYELRQNFILALKSKDYETIDQYLDKLNLEIKKMFLPIELMLLRKQYFNKLSIAYILTTKLLWRFKGYPRLK